MTFEWYVRIMHDCNSADPNIVTIESMRYVYEKTDMDKYPHTNYLCIMTPKDMDTEGRQYIQLFWVNEQLRGRGIGKKLLNQIDVPHGMVVDVRSKAMHHLCQTMGYKQSTTYNLDGKEIHLHGGDMYYYKE